MEVKFRKFMNRPICLLAFFVLLISGCVSSPTKIYYDNEVSTPAIPYIRPAPKYPVAAAKKGINGYIVVDLIISENGDVEDIEIVQSVPAGVFDSNGKRAIKTWKFKPAEVNGNPVKQHAKVRLDWAI